jgi:hypothetical protein
LVPVPAVLTVGPLRPRGRFIGLRAAAAAHRPGPLGRGESAEAPPLLRSSPPPAAGGGKRREKGEKGRVGPVPTPAQRAGAIPRFAGRRPVERASKASSASAEMGGLAWNRATTAWRAAHHHCFLMPEPLCRRLRPSVPSSLRPSSCGAPLGLEQEKRRRRRGRRSTG